MRFLNQVQLNFLVYSVCYLILLQTQLEDILNKINESKGFDILYSIEKNSWNGNTELQLVIVDLKLK